MKIFDKNGVELLDVKVTDESYRYREIMSTPTLTLYFQLREFVELPVGAYTDFQGERFYLFDTLNFTKNGNEDFNHTLILHGVAERLHRYRFYDFVNGGLVFTLTAFPADHIAMLVNVLNQKDGGGWSAGTVDDMAEIVVNYNHNSCMEALAMMADEAETEFEITKDKVIHFRKTEYNKSTPLSIAYGQGTGLKPGVQRKNDDNKRPIERLFVQGGTRNIDYSKYGSKYLLLPANQTLLYNGVTYQVDPDGKYIQRSGASLVTGQESSLDASGIYPSRICTVTQLQVDDLAASLFTVIDSTVPEALNFERQVIAGQTMTIVFQSGMLTGKEFEISRYTHDFRSFEIVPKDYDGYTMPGGAWLPEEGDTFVVYGCAFPEAYIRDDASKTGASWDMFREAVVFIAKEEDEQYSYGGSISPIWLKSGWSAISPKLVIGGYCALDDPELGGVDIRIRSIKDYINYPYDVEIDLSNALVKPSISSLLSKINSYTASLSVQQLIEMRDTGVAAGIDINVINQYIRNYFPGFDVITGNPADNSALWEFLLQIWQNSYADSQTRLISGAVIWKEGMTYETTDFRYKIMGTLYSSQATEITLEPSNPSSGRIDVFYLDIFSNIQVKTGTPSANPIEPILLATDLFVTSVYIGPGATEPTEISVEKIYDEKTAQEWSPSVTSDAGNTSVNLEATADPYAGIKHISIEVDAPDETVSLPQHYIGERYQGGIVFWIDPTDSRKGLISAEFDTVTDELWSRLNNSSPYTTGATGQTMYAGLVNTAQMLANNAAKNYAARWVDELQTGGYSDWYIGSRDEMLQLWERRNVIGNFNPSKDYWTSSEVSWDQALRVDWQTGTVIKRDKNTRRNVRAIRKFDDSTIPSSNPLESYAPQSTSIIFSAPDEVIAAEGVLSFRMKTSMPWLTNSRLLIETYRGAVRTGYCLVGISSNLFGFNPFDTDNYQLLGIFHANFALSQNRFDAFKFSLAGEWPNGVTVYIDTIKYQHTSMLQERAQPVLQIQEQVLKVDKWAESGDIYEYVFENPNIKDTSEVDIIISNADIELARKASFLPETDSSKGLVRIYAENLPEGDIRITINIKEVSL